MEYSFEHGIADCGHEGIAPILAVGHRVTERDFVERNLTGIRGISISQRGLSKGTRWKDLNLSYLYARLPGIEYLRILFDDPISLDAFGPMPSLRYLVVDCPTVRHTLQGEMPNLRTAHLRWPDRCTSSMLAPSLETLTLIRPRSENLNFLGHLPSLRTLDIHYSRALQSLEGLQSLRALNHLGLHDCSNFTALDILGPVAGPAQLVIDGCTKFVDGTGAERLSSLRKLCVFRGERGPREIRLPQRLQERSIELDLRGVSAQWT